MRSKKVTSCAASIASTVVLSCVTTASAQNAPYSPVIEANGVLYVAGHLGRDPETRELAGEIKEETRQTLKNIEKTLRTVNSSLADVVRCQVFLDDIDDFDDMNSVYRQFFPLNPPARTTVAVEDLALGAKTEIECTAVRRDEDETEELLRPIKN